MEVSSGAASFTFSSTFCWYGARQRLIPLARHSLKTCLKPTRNRKNKRVAEKRRANGWVGLCSANHDSHHKFVDVQRVSFASHGNPCAVKLSSLHNARYLCKECGHNSFYLVRGICHSSRIWWNLVSLAIRNAILSIKTHINTVCLLSVAVPLWWHPVKMPQITIMHAFASINKSACISHTKPHERMPFSLFVVEINRFFVEIIGKCVDFKIQSNANNKAEENTHFRVVQNEFDAILKRAQCVLPHKLSGTIASSI